MEHFVAFPANDLRRKWILFRIVGKGICPMLFQLPFPAFHLQLRALPDPWLNNGFMVILNIKLLDFPLIHHTLLCQEVRRVAFLQKGIPLYFSFSSMLASVMACHFVLPFQFTTPSLSKIRLI